MDSQCIDEDDEWMCNLRFVRSDIDPATVKPIAPHQLAALINEFLIRSADILNKFCAQFENRMIQLDIRLDTFERMLALLERKLENIPCEEADKPPAEEGKETLGGMGGTTARGEKEEETAGRETERMMAREEEGKGMSSGRTTEEKQTDKHAAKPPAEGTVEAREHPKTAKYFKMLKMGVPEAAVRQKMRSEGVDDALLSDPNKRMALTPKQIEGSPSSRRESDDSSSADEE